jgi:hypothetical protein
MSDRWRQDLEDSIYDFDRLVAAPLEKRLGGRVRRTEGRRDPLLRMLDMSGGIDAFCETRNGIFGIASRVQWLDRDWLL